MATAKSVYDWEHDREPFAFTVGLPVQCGRLAGAVEALLAHPDDEIARALARAALDAFHRWQQETEPVASRRADTEPNV